MNDGVKQADVTPSAAILPASPARRSQGASSACGTRALNWYLKQAIFPVVNNQQLCGSQLGGAHLFSGRLISVYPSSFVDFVNWV